MKTTPTAILRCGDVEFCLFDANSVVDNDEICGNLDLYAHDAANDM